MGDSNGRLCVGVMGTASKGSQAARGLNTWEAKKLSESDSKWLYQILKGLGRWDRKKRTRRHSAVAKDAEERRTMRGRNV